MVAPLVPVILSGGSGTRLWPLSLPHRPKQLQALSGERTMIQDTALRSAGLEGSRAPLVVCNETQASMIEVQLAAVGATPSAIVIEPEARNTAPAVAAAAHLLEPETVMAVLPADHVITDVDAFRSSLTAAADAAAGGSIVTFGIVPTRPDAGFGYLEVGRPAGGTAPLIRFVEKPDEQTAKEYVNAGYLWNSGMFVFTAGVMLEEMRRLVPEVEAAAARAVEEARRNDGLVRLGGSFAAAPSISLDHAVMEHTERGRAVPLDAGWSDVGSWQALWEVAAPDGGTVAEGPVFSMDVERSYLRAESKPVAVIGLSDVVVVETPEAVLVMDRHRAQEVRAAAAWFSSIRPEE
jgi:mannose-1-phosphate guanylyltransferase / mannose-6-phosphate isomerase